MGDFEDLRIQFCALVLQARGGTVSNFVAWLDLKVAEYKVYGHMVLNEAIDEETGAWQDTTPTDPDNWPRSESAGLMHTSTDFSMSAKPNPSVDSLVHLPVKRLARSVSCLVSKRRGGGIMRSKTVSKILTKAISRSAKNATNIVLSGTLVSSPSCRNNALPCTDTSGTHEDAQYQGQFSNEISVSGASAETLVKIEPGVAMIEGSMDQSNVNTEQSPSVPYSMGNNGNQVFSSSLLGISQQRTPSTSRGAGISGRRGRGAICPSGLGRLTPATVSNGSKGRGWGYVQPITVGKAANKETVKQLLDLHTAHTENGQYMCGLCNVKITNWSSMTRHMKAHLGIQYECPHCTTTFKWQHHIKKHLEKFHNIVT